MSLQESIKPSPKRFTRTHVQQVGVLMGCTLLAMILVWIFIRRRKKTGFTRLGSGH
jgi:LPXTG-motif cell wall-anchored protein